MQTPVASFPWEWLRELHHLLPVSTPVLRQELQKKSPGSPRYTIQTDTKSNEIILPCCEYVVINIWEVLSVGKIIWEIIRKLRVLHSPEGWAANIKLGSGCEQKLKTNAQKIFIYWTMLCTWQTRWERGERNVMYKGRVKSSLTDSLLISHCLLTHYYFQSVAFVTSTQELFFHQKFWICHLRYRGHLPFLISFFHPC